MLSLPNSQKRYKALRKRTKRARYLVGCPTVPVSNPHVRQAIISGNRASANNNASGDCLDFICGRAAVRAEEIKPPAAFLEEVAVKDIRDAWVFLDIVRKPSKSMCNIWRNLTGGYKALLANKKMFMNVVTIPTLQHNVRIIATKERYAHLKEAEFDDMRVVYFDDNQTYDGHIKWDSNQRKHTFIAERVGNELSSRVIRIPITINGAVTKKYLDFVENEIKLDHIICPNILIQLYYNQYRFKWWRPLHCNGGLTREQANPFDFNSSQFAHHPEWWLSNKFALIPLLGSGGQRRIIRAMIGGLYLLHDRQTLALVEDIVYSHDSQFIAFRPVCKLNNTLNYISNYSQIAATLDMTSNKLMAIDGRGELRKILNESFVVEKQLNVADAAQPDFYQIVCLISSLLSTHNNQAGLKRIVYQDYLRDLLDEATACLRDLPPNTQIHPAALWYDKTTKTFSQKDKSLGVLQCQLLEVSHELLGKTDVYHTLATFPSHVFMDDVLRVVTYICAECWKHPILINGVSHIVVPVFWKSDLKEHKGLTCMKEPVHWRGKFGCVRCNSLHFDLTNPQFQFYFHPRAKENRLSLMGCNSKGFNAPTCAKTPEQWDRTGSGLEFMSRDIIPDEKTMDTHHALQYDLAHSLKNVAVQLVHSIIFCSPYFKGDNQAQSRLWGHIIEIELANRGGKSSLDNSQKFMTDMSLDRAINLLWCLRLAMIRFRTANQIPPNVYDAAAAVIDTLFTLKSGRYFNTIDWTRLSNLINRKICSDLVVHMYSDDDPLAVAHTKSAVTKKEVLTRWTTHNLLHAILDGIKGVNLNFAETRINEKCNMFIKAAVGKGAQQEDVANRVQFMILCRLKMVWLLEGGHVSADGDIFIPAEAQRREIRTYGIPQTTVEKFVLDNWREFTGFSWFVINQYIISIPEQVSVVPKWHLEKNRRLQGYINSCNNVCPNFDAKTPKNGVEYYEKANIRRKTKEVELRIGSLVYYRENLVANSASAASIVKLMSILIIFKKNQKLWLHGFLLHIPMKNALEKKFDDTLHLVCAERDIHVTHVTIELNHVICPVWNWPEGRFKYWLWWYLGQNEHCTAEDNPLWAQYSTEISICSPQAEWRQTFELNNL